MVDGFLQILKTFLNLVKADSREKVEGPARINNKETHIPYSKEKNVHNIKMNTTVIEILLMLQVLEVEELHMKQIAAKERKKM